MKNLKRLLSIALTVAMLVVTCCSALTANAQTINTFELSTGDPDYAVEADCTQLDLDIKFDVNHQYGFVGGEFLLDLPNALTVQEITVKDIAALDGITSIDIALVEIAQKDNRVRFIVDDAKQSCRSITFTVKLNAVSSLVAGNRYTVSLTAENGAFKNIYSQNDDIAFSPSNRSVNIHIHDNNGADLTCSVCNKYIGKWTPAKPNKPSVLSKTDTTITLKPLDGYEYKMGSGDWQTSNVFENLTPNKSYTFYQRVAETDKSNASETSASFTVITKKVTDVHTLTHIDEIPATCTTAGQKEHDKCTECGNTYIDNKPETDLIIPAKSHVLTQKEGKTPTCEEAGWSPYEYCSACDYTTHEAIAKLGHNLKDVPEKPVTDCSVDGMQAHQECNNGCGKLFVNGEEVDGSTLVIKAEHNLLYVAYKAPTCTENGNEEHQKCSRCSRTFINNIEADVIIPAAHTLTEHAAKAATCTQAGHNAYVECSVCDYTTFEKIDATGHTEADAVKENETAPTCTADGSYDSVVYCTVCREEISRNVVVVDATGHTLTEHAAKAATCTQAGHNAYVECSVCDYTTFEEIDATGHTAADAVKENETAPTCTADGSYESVVKCSVCNEELSRDTVIIPATGHDKVQVAAKEPTTTEIGWNAYEYCNNCDYTTYQERPKLPIDKGEWKKNAKGWWYEYADGSYAIGWKKIDNVWYYFNTSGYMQTGWQKIKNVWYYFKSSGAMVTDWQKISNVWYYFDQNGAMQTGWEKIANVWYYFDASGAMQTGWEKVSGKWYYFDASGAMQTGWEKIGGTWYYFETSGAMLANTSRNIGGKVYKFNASGACTNP